MNTESLKTLAPTVLRISLSLVFLYFGFTQLQRPETFIGWLPAEAALIPLSARTLIVLNGSFEVIAGIALFIGIYTRLSSALLGLHLLAITISIGYTEIGVRDFGLALAALSIALFGADKMCLETFLHTKADKQRVIPSSNTAKMTMSKTL